MATCVRLFRADNIRAFYAQRERLLVVSADVTLNPYADDVGICRNPLQRVLPQPEVGELMVVGSTRPGIHPQVVVTRTIQAHFPMDTKPARIAVFTMGIDNPARVVVPVATRRSGGLAESGPGMGGESGAREDSGSWMGGESGAQEDSGAWMGGEGGAQEDSGAWMGGKGGAQEDSGAWMGGEGGAQEDSGAWMGGESGAREGSGSGMSGMTGMSGMGGESGARGASPSEVSGQTEEREEPGAWMGGASGTRAARGPSGKGESHARPESEPGRMGMWESAPRRERGGGARAHAAGGTRLHEATGWSEKYSFEEALADALAKLHGQIYPGSRNPDMQLSAQVAGIGAEIGGLRHGLWIKVRAR
jgi:hypothetical protein